MKLSVVLCTYNPRLDYLQQLIDSLKDQTLPPAEWEFILVDNNSSNGFTDEIDLEWQPNARIVVEKQQGLVFSRIKGTLSANTEIIVSIDDDTPLHKEYLQTALNLFREHPEVGIAGGKCQPVYETTPPEWIDMLPSSIAGRNFGDDLIIEAPSDPISYPHYGPILILYRKSVFLKYIESFSADQKGQLGRKANHLASGEDNDIILFFVKSGYSVAYHPGLMFRHFIPSRRLTLDYARQLLFESNRSWIKVLHFNGINPWRPISKFTYLPRCILSWLKNKAWQSARQSLFWKSTCGFYKGLSEIK